MKKVWKGLLAATLMAGMLAGCSGGSEEASGGKKGGTVKIGGIFDLTGGTGDVGTPYAEGEKAFLNPLQARRLTAISSN